MNILNLLNKIKVIGTIAIVAIMIVSAARSANHAFAGVNDNVRGFLWSDMPDGSDECLAGVLATSFINGIPGCGPGNGSNPGAGRGFGWISLNKTDLPCPFGQLPCPDYGVNLDMTSGNFTGYGWSEYGGWLQFNPPGPYPSGGGLGASAQISPLCLNGSQTTCPVNGWIRFIAGGTPESGGWDGWVNLRGAVKTGGTYGVTYDKATHTFSGKAWGDMVVGWVDFSQARVTVIPPGMSQCLNNNTTPPSVIYYPTGSVPPKGCSPLTPTDLICYDAQGGTHTYPLGTLPPKICTTFTPIPPQDPTNICNDSTAYNFGQPGPCTYDFCPVKAVQGEQQQNSGPWQGTDGQLWGLSGGICIPDQCPDNADDETKGFQAYVPFIGSNGSSYNMVDGVCQKLKPCTDPKLCPKKPITPIYKEN